MKAKLLLACIVTIVAMPTNAFASNNPELTYPTGTRLKAEEPLRAINIGSPTVTWGGTTITCSSSSLKGKLKKNSGTEIEADIESASFNSGGECATGGLGASISTTPAENGIPWCLRSTPEHLEHEFQIAGGKCGELKPIRLAINTTVPTVVEECGYERALTVVGTYQTHPNDAVLTNKAVSYSKVSGPLLCSSTMSLTTSFTFEKEEGSAGPVYLDSGPKITFPTGTTLGIGSKLKGTAVGAIVATFGGGLVFECPSGELTGTLKKNSGTEVEVDVESGAFIGPEPGGTCKSPFGNLTWTLKPATNGLPWCLRGTSGMAADEFQIRGNNCGATARPIRIVYERILNTNTECVYQRYAPLAGTYTTHPEDAVLSFKNAVFLEVEPRKASCPDEAQLDSSMTLEKDAEGTNPLFIS